MASCLKKLISYKLTMDIVLIFLLLVIMFFAIWTRALIGSKKNFVEAEKYFNEQQYIKAITFFDRSMHWYIPFNPYIDKSAESLWEISEQAEQINDERLHLFAIETIKNSFYSSRSFYTPGTEWIKRCDDKIQNIIKNKNEEIFKVKDEIESQDKTDKQVIVYNDPDILWTIVLEIGLFGWIGAVLGFIFYYLRPYLKTRKYIHNYWFWILVAAVSYSIWIIGLIKA